jgi:DNA-binding NarL/FixJ family response regulator
MSASTPSARLGPAHSGNGTRVLALGQRAAPPGLPANVLIAEERSMAADTMVRSVKRAEGLILASRCASRLEVAAACISTPPDVAVLHMGLYDHDACSAVACVREQAGLVKVLLLAADPDPEHLVRALMAGADNCISDRVDQRAFVAAIRATATGRSVLPATLERSVAQVMLELQEADSHRLSPRELDVLRLASQGLCVSDIATRLFISANTTRTHLQRSYRKLGVVNRSGAVATAIRKGILG